MAIRNPARVSMPMAATALLLAVVYVIVVYRFRLSFTDSASLASILGFGLTLLTIATLAVAAIAVRNTLADLSKRLVLGDVARAVSLAEEFRRLCHHEEWEHAATQADALGSVLSRLCSSSALLKDERAFVRTGALDVPLVSAKLRKINRGAPPKLDPVTFRSLDALILRLSETEGRLRDLGRETSDA